VKKLALLMALFLELNMLAGCKNRITVDVSSEKESSTVESICIHAPAETFPPHETDEPLEPTGEIVCIDLNGMSADAESGVLFSNTDITFTQGGIYRLSGTLEGGSIIVSAPSDTALQLIFDGAHITGNNTPLSIKSAGKVILSLAENSQNSLTGKDTALFSNSPLTINGPGTLTVQSESGHGIAVKNTLHIAEGNLSIEAAKNGISADTHLQFDSGIITIHSGGGHENGKHPPADYADGSNPDSASSFTDKNTKGMGGKGLKSDGDILITNGTFIVDSADDAIHSNASLTISGGSFSVKSGDDALHADSILTVSDGNITVPYCYEGFEAHSVYISGGSIDINAMDDGINATDGTGRNEGEGELICISDGTVRIKALGDGLDSNGSVEIRGGYITVVCPKDGDSASLDYAKTGEISGGTFIGTGARGMAKTFSQSSQGVVGVSVGAREAKTPIRLLDKSGNLLFSLEPDYSFAVVIISSPDLVTGEEYSLSVGDTTSIHTAK